jgi:hypothetical protein
VQCSLVSDIPEAAAIGTACSYNRGYEEYIQTFDGERLGNKHA